MVIRVAVGRKRRKDDGRAGKSHREHFTQELGITGYVRIRKPEPKSLRLYAQFSIGTNRFLISQIPNGGRCYSLRSSMRRLAVGDSNNFDVKSGLLQQGHRPADSEYLVVWMGCEYYGPAQRAERLDSQCICATHIGTP